MFLPQFYKVALKANKRNAFRNLHNKTFLLDCHEIYPKAFVIFCFFSPCITFSACGVQRCHSCWAAPDSYREHWQQPQEGMAVRLASFPLPGQTQKYSSLYRLLKGLNSLHQGQVVAKWARKVLKVRVGEMAYEECNSQKIGCQSLDFSCIYANLTNAC